MNQARRSLNTTSRPPTIEWAANRRCRCRSVRQVIHPKNSGTSRSRGTDGSPTTNVTAGFDTAGNPHQGHHSRHHRQDGVDQSETVPSQGRVQIPCTTTHRRTAAPRKCAVPEPYGDQGTHHGPHEGHETRCFRTGLLGLLALADFAGDFFAGGLDREVPVFPGLFEPRVEVRDAMDPRLSADRVCPSHVEVARGVRVASTTVSVRSTRGAEHTDSPGLWTPRVSRRHDPSKVLRRRADGRPNLR